MCVGGMVVVKIGEVAEGALELVVESKKGELVLNTDGRMVTDVNLPGRGRPTSYRLENILRNT